MLAPNGCPSRRIDWVLQQVQSSVPEGHPCVTTRLPNQSARWIQHKGPPAFATWRSVKPSAQPTLVRTQHPPPKNPQLLLGILSCPVWDSKGKQDGQQTVDSVRSWPHQPPLCLKCVGHIPKGVGDGPRMRHCLWRGRCRIRNSRDICGMDHDCSKRCLGRARRLFQLRPASRIGARELQAASRHTRARHSFDLFRGRAM